MKAAFLKTVGYNSMRLRKREDQQEAATYDELQEKAYNKIKDKYNKKIDALLQS